MRPLTYGDFLQALAIVHGWTVEQADAATKRPLAESALAAAHSGFGDTELYPDAISKAAITGARVASNHAAIDGNKRTGLLLMAAMLDVAGWKFSISDDELAELFERLAGKAPVLTETDFVEAIRDSVKPR